DLNSYGIPKLILQPLVENCILHGILNKEDQTGWIKIQAKKAQGGISLSVSDNGVGIEPSRLKELQTLILGAEKNLQQSTSSINHFGLLNTVSRLQAYYGDSLHIELSSQPQQGVQIHFYLPLEQNGRLAHPSSGDTQPVHY
ncbi:MAG: ATP-binding protein, partial [Oscillospiraceae bacterium]|nr:ATP-binding protein [Oscillospiraceae bacterium]